MPRNTLHLHKNNMSSAQLKAVQNAECHDDIFNEFLQAEFYTFKTGFAVNHFVFPCCDAYNTVSRHLKR